MKKYIELEGKETTDDAVVRVVQKVFDRKAKDYPPGQYVIVDQNGRVSKVMTVTGPGRTEQSYKDDTDINRLLQPAIKKGLLRHVEKFAGEYDDIPVESFQDAQFIVAKGQNMFEALPSYIRDKFGTPAKFMEFVQNPDNETWLRKNGLLKGLDGVDRKGALTGYAPKETPPGEEAPAPEAPAE